ncbi:MAG: tautomerase family protein [Selenomonadaceae bacterium]|nr:tautomerase family protein [Selenomonadaceae bacterium]
MPAISVKSIALAESQKKVLAKKYVEIFSEITNVPKDRVYIFFDGHELEDVGAAGIRFSEHPSKAWSKFNEDEWSKNPEIVERIKKAAES